MNEIDALIRDIETFCRSGDIAESTFGRLAAGNSKLVMRLREGKSVTLKTVQRVREYMRAHGTADAASAPGPAIERPHAPASPAPQSFEKPFRFYDNRQKYLAFVYTCNEKVTIAQRTARELQHIQPGRPGLRVFDAGTGDGLVLTELLRTMHHRHPTVPFFINGKEISDENARLCLEKMPDRFCEHPATVLVISNMRYREAPALRPADVHEAAALNWIEVALRGSSSHDFAQQIAGLERTLKDGWATRRSEKSGNPVPVRPSVLVLYREDHRLLLDMLLPRLNDSVRLYDLVVASHPWRAREPAATKVRNILAPMARCLAPGGRLVVIQAFGDDPGQEILQEEWPGEAPFSVRRHDLLRELKKELGGDAGRFHFNAYSDNKALFRYRMHTLSAEATENPGTSILLAAWNAAIYVGQVQDERLQSALARGTYLDSTRRVLAKHGGLWFNNECFVISRNYS
jgi:SAM-dependent methyltransferase